jgi:hypothetical protein
MERAVCFPQKRQVQISIPLKSQAANSNKNAEIC